MPEEMNTASGGSTGSGGGAAAPAGAGNANAQTGVDAGGGAEGTHFGDFLADMGLTIGSATDGTGAVGNDVGQGAAGKGTTKQGEASRGREVAASTDQAEEGEGQGVRDKGQETDADAEEDGEGDEDEGDGERTEGDEDGDGESHLDKGLKALDKHPELKGLKKRFKQLLQQNPQLKRDNARLTKQLESAGELPPVRIEGGEADGPLAGANTADEVDSWVKEARALRDWLDENPEGGEFELPDGRKMKFEGEQKLKAVKKQARRILEDAPSRKEHLRQVEESRAGVRKAQPTLYQKGHADHEMRQTLLERVPGLLRLTDHDEVVRAYVAGRKLLEDERTGKASWHRVVKGQGAREKGQVTEGARTEKLPVVKQGATGPKGVVQATERTPVQEVMAKARTTGGVSVDEMVDAGVMG